MKFRIRLRGFNSRWQPTNMVIFWPFVTKPVVLKRVWSSFFVLFCFVFAVFCSLRLACTCEETFDHRKSLHKFNVQLRTCEGLPLRLVTSYVFLIATNKSDKKIFWSLRGIYEDFRRSSEVSRWKKYFWEPNFTFLSTYCDFSEE